MRPVELRALGAMGALSSLLLLAAPALAFPTGSQFDGDPIASAGGGGVFFTGESALPAATCATCHTGGPGNVGVRLEVDDATLFSAGYVPGNAYRLAVVLLNETRGLEHNAGGPRCGNVRGRGFVPCNSNGFALQTDDASGAAVGGLEPSDPVTVLSMDGSAVASTGYLPASGAQPAGNENGVTRWPFSWTAPAAGSGPVTFHIGVVDGNGGEGTADVPWDTLDDDTVEAHITAAEAGSTTPFASGGCTVAAQRSTSVRPLGGILVLLATAMTRSRRARRRREVARKRSTDA